MNKTFEHINLFMEKMDFPQEARDVFLEVNSMIDGDTPLNIIAVMSEDYRKDHKNYNDLENLKKITEACKKVDFHECTVDFVYYMRMSEYLLEKYHEQGLPENIFWDSMCDLKAKLWECKNVYNIWGTFVAPWFYGFFNLTRFKLGRLQYELCSADFDYDKHGLKFKKGDMIINTHIPSGEKFTADVRLDSYKKAYGFYIDKFEGDVLPIQCSSWFLYPGNEAFYPENSNIIDFAHDFEIVKSVEKDDFPDFWRVFNMPNGTPLEKVPADTSLRRAYIDYLSKGGKTGSAVGIMAFDGENILTRR